MPDQPDDIRVSDAERDAALATLREAAAEGRLSLEEMSERTGDALTARTRGELAAVTRDLPAAPAPEAAPERTTRWLVGVMGGMDRRGRWRLGRHCRVINIMGGCDLDLSDAVIEGPEVDITVWSLMGGSDITVPEGVAVDLGGIALLGANDLRAEGPLPRPGAPVVRVRAYSLMGGTDVRVRPSRRRNDQGPAR